MSHLSNVRRLPVGIFLAVLVAGSASAVDTPVPAKVHMVKQDKKAGFVGKLAKLIAKPSGNDFALPGSAPTANGATLRFFQVGVPGTWDSIALPAAQWTGIGGGAKGFKYKGAGSGADPCKIVLVKPTVIKALCKGPESSDSPTPYSIPVGAAGAGWELVVGADRYCAESSAATGADIKKNDGTSGTFLAVNASAPSECSDPVGPQQGCTSASITIVSSYTPPAEDVSGVNISVAYPGPKLQLNGSPQNLTGVSGIFNFGDNDVNVPGDGFNDSLSVGLLAIPGDIPPGNFAHADFNCRAGAPAPVLGDFTCVSDVSDSLGNTVQSTCSVSLVVTP